MERGEGTGDEHSLVGLTAPRARERAQRLGLEVRVLLRPGAVHTLEHVEGRVNLVVDEDDVVERVFHG